MPAESDVFVKLDDRVRLMSALLAATHYPDREQAGKPHGTHAHARATRKYISAFASHPAVLALQGLFGQGAPLEALFSLALVLRLPDGKAEKPPRWLPPHWDEQILDFYAVSDLAAWWQSEAAPWEQALAETQRALAGVQFKLFLRPFLGDIPERLVFIPNIAYPTDAELGLRLGSDLICIAPPRVAWGDNPPWPFDEDPAHLYRAALVAYGRLLMQGYLHTHAERLGNLSANPLPVTEKFQALYPTWTEQFANLFVAGAVAIYLEEYVSRAEANAYVLMERKMRGLEILPGVINVLRHYLHELETGRYRTLLDLLPNFSRRLRIANKIVSM